MKYIVKIDIPKTAEQIAKLRKERNLSVKEIQEEFGFSSPQAIFKWQRGDNLPTLDNLVLLAEILGVTVNDILVISRQEKKPASPSQ